MHTGVTCSDFVSNNPSDELTDAQYGVKSGKVNNVAPGVMFYYITITAPSASFTINVTQSNDKGWKPIPVQGDEPDHPVRGELHEEQQGNGVVQRDDRDLDDHRDRSDGRCDVHRRDQVQPERPRWPGCVLRPFPIVTYSFATNIGGANVPSSGDTIIVSPKP